MPSLSEAVVQISSPAAGGRSGPPAAAKPPGQAFPTGSSGGFPETRIKAWNLDTAQRIGQPLESRGYLASLEIGEVDGAPVVVAGHSDTRADRDELSWVWDLASGEQLTEPFGFTPQWSWQDSLGIKDQVITELDGAPVVVVSHDSNIRVWDLRTGDLLVGDPGRLGQC